MTDPSTIRRQALEEALAVLPRLSTPTMDSVWSGGWNSCVQWVEAKLNALLAEDPRQASESGKVEYTGHPELGTPDPDHPLYRRPAPELTPLTDDYGPLPEPEPAKTYHDGVRDALSLVPADAKVIDAVMAKKMDQWIDGWNACREHMLESISALLPQPKNEAEEIVERWEDYAEEQTGLVPVREMQVGAASMLRWLLSQGWRAPE